MDLHGKTALVTGVGDRNLGHHFVEELLDRGARTVYAAARRTDRITIPGATVLRLDLDDADSIAHAAAAAPDIDLLVNNAANFAAGLEFLTGDLDQIKQVFTTNVFGTLQVTRAFTPALLRRPGSSILNVLSAAAWSTFPGINVYGASKAAALSMSNAIREELADQGVQVTNLVFGIAGTAPMRAYAGAVASDALHQSITDPRDIVRTALDGLEAEQVEVLGDQLAIDAKSALAGPLRSVYSELLGQQ